MFDFFSSGRTRACLSWAGKTPLCNDKLQMWQMTGAIQLDRRLSSQVGIGSSSHDFAGVLFSKLMISLTVAGVSELRGSDWRATMTGGLADVVDIRMLSTLLRKNCPKSSAESLSVACCRGGCSNLLTVCHRTRGLPSQVLTVASQNEVNLD